MIGKLGQRLTNPKVRSLSFSFVTKRRNRKLMSKKSRVKEGLGFQVNMSWRRDLATYKTRECVGLYMLTYFMKGNCET